jgi:hypothetical protein
MSSPRRRASLPMPLGTRHIQRIVIAKRLLSSQVRAA